MLSRQACESPCLPSLPRRSRPKPSAPGRTCWLNFRGRYVEKGIANRHWSLSLFMIYIYVLSATTTMKSMVRGPSHKVSSCLKVYTSQRKFFHLLFATGCLRRSPLVPGHVAGVFDAESLQHDPRTGHSHPGCPTGQVVPPCATAGSQQTRVC